MERALYELSVLAKAVAHKNLLGASQHVGLSQPQLSRIIKRIENTFSVVLLDRSAKRNASWTPSAYSLATFYTKKMRSFDRDMEALLQQSQAKQIVVGTLEGLIDVALPYIHQLLEAGGLQLAEIDVFDLDRLESLFSRGELDVIFTSREPGRKKYANCLELGFQSIDRIESNPHFQVVSTFEFGKWKKETEGKEKVLISNSLAIRRSWFQKFGGVGTLPSEPKKKQGSKKDTEHIYLLGSDTLSPILWNQIQKTSLL
jgi:hypothetical protein